MQRFECSLTTQYMVVQPRGYMYHIPNVACAKEVCNRAVTYQPAQARKSGEKVRDSLLCSGLHSGTHFFIGKKDGISDVSPKPMIKFYDAKLIYR